MRTEKHCPCCGQSVGETLTMEEYKERALPRLSAIDNLAKKIDFSSFSWRDTTEGARYSRLMDEQIRDELAAGL